MSRTALDIPRLVELCGAVCDGVVTDADAAELDALLASTAEARRVYGMVVDMHLDLEAEVATATAEPIIMPAPRSIPWRGVAWAAALLIAAGVIAVVATTITDPASPVQPARSVGVVLDAGGVIWDSPPLRSGDELTPQTLRIARGRVELALHSGTTLTVLAPAELSLRSTGRCELTHGRLTAHVPGEAVGFTVATPRFTVTDLGTAFGVRVDRDGGGEVFVFDGQVAVDDGERTLLDAGRGRRYAAGGAGEDFGVATRPDEKATRVVRYRFDEAAGDPLVDWGFGFEGGPFEVTASDRPEGFKRVPGVFGSAIELEPGVTIPTPFEGLAGGAARTVAMWVRVPANAGLDASQAMVGWGDAGVAGGAFNVSWNYFGPKETFGTLRVYLGGGLVVTGQTDLRDGAWHHVAVTLEPGEDGAADTSDLRMYVDGGAEAVSRETRGVIRTVVRTDGSRSMTLGADPISGVGRFRGAIDELRVYDRALTADEVMRLMKTNAATEAEADMQTWTR